MMLGEKIQAYTNTINHALIVVVTIYITSVCWNVGPTARSWHIWLCTIGVRIEINVQGDCCSDNIFQHFFVAILVWFSTNS